MTTTTSYGSWIRARRFSTTVEHSVIEAFGSEGPGGYDFDKIVAQYRKAINEALPDGVVLAGNEFYGPYYPYDQDFTGYPVDEFGDLGIEEIVDGIDLQAIIEQHRTEA